jgi:hypothetical protein
MSQDYSLADFDSAVRRLGRLFYDWTQSQVAPEPWNLAVLEIRYAEDDSYWHDKMRVQLDNQKIISLGTTNSIREMIAKFNELRKVLGWYSMKLQIDREGKVEVTYGYDADCAEDPSFFAD